MTAPLDGIRVLDLTRVLSGPHCCRMLADMGADVIKIEPPAGDLTRFSAPRRHGLASYFTQQNVGKRNLSIDLGVPAGVELMLDLVEHADVLVENYRPGVTTKLGFGPAVALERNPRLVYCAISGYGQTGPWVRRRAYAPVVEAEAGVIAKQGEARGGIHVKDPYSHGDVYAALEAAYAVVSALFQRTRTGRGQVLDVSMAESLLYVNEHLHDELWDGDVDPHWIRSFRPHDYAVLRVADGDRVIISGHPAERGTFEFFVAAMDRPDLLQDPRFVDVAARLLHLGELQDLLRDFALTFPDVDTFEAHLARHRLAVGKVREPGELANTDWARARRAIVDVDDRGGGRIRVPNAPWKLSDAPDVGVHGVAKYRGEDNHSVLRDVLRYDDDRIASLERDGVVSMHLPRSAPSDATSLHRDG